MYESLVCSWLHVKSQKILLTSLDRWALQKDTLHCIDIGSVYDMDNKPKGNPKSPLREQFPAT